MIEHWHILVTRDGEEAPRNYCAFQIERIAREKIESIFSNLAGDDCTVEPPWGSIVSPSGNEGWVMTRKEYERRGVTGRKALVSMERVFWELAPCAEEECELYDPNIAEARERAYGLEWESKERQHKANIAEHGVVETHLHPPPFDNSEAETYYAETLRRLREQYAEHPLLLRNLELNSNYRRSAGAHQYEFEFS